MYKRWQKLSKTDKVSQKLPNVCTILCQRLKHWESCRLVFGKFGKMLLRCNGNVYDAGAAPFVLSSLLCCHQPTISAPSRYIPARFPTKRFWHNVFSAIQQSTGDEGGRFAEGGKGKIPSFRRKQKFQLFCKFAF